MSNFQVNHLLEIINLNSSIPSVNQVGSNFLLIIILLFFQEVEFHPSWHEDELVDFCKKHSITFNSYSPGGAPDHALSLGPSWNPIPDMRKHPNITQIAQNHNKAAAQVIYRWHWQEGIVINPRPRNSTQMIENLFIFDFELDIQDMMTLTYLNHPITKMGNDPRLIL